ncbi:hypothetical protein BU23DRAFT_464499, partial [Bimuria novae-zelandiae CBS 107.79]
VDTNRYNANLVNKYYYFFNLLYSKIDQYRIDPYYIYNIDKKGYLISIISRLKRIFSR